MESTVNITELYRRHRVIRVFTNISHCAVYPVNISILESAARSLYHRNMRSIMTILSEHELC